MKVRPRVRKMVVDELGELSAGSWRAGGERGAHGRRVRPERHIHGAACLGADVRDATPDDAGEIVAKQLITMMKACGIPNGVGGVGYTEQDVEALTTGAWAQQRLITNAAREVNRADLSNIFRGAMQYW